MGSKGRKTEEGELLLGKQGYLSLLSNRGKNTDKEDMIVAVAAFINIYALKFKITWESCFVMN